jgi:hypothetical protein
VMVRMRGAEATVGAGIEDVRLEAHRWHLAVTEGPEVLARGLDGVDRHEMQ